MTRIVAVILFRVMDSWPRHYFMLGVAGGIQVEKGGAAVFAT